ncbi:MAG: helix-hairpin-helix domain-containing protein, partial [Anaerolineales bacterium]|nr:helix-hairpin-helix domain-containing protein [Anaerolineales bacterium]
QDDNADWLAKLDLVDDQPSSESGPPAISVDSKVDVVSDEKEKIEESGISGGMLDRLKEPDEQTPDEEVPEWLEDLKKEEDPQETAILWLKQFVEQGEEVNIQAEIKRYTDELTPGDMVPKWMEDLKHEEDPQTTAMLWLEKFSGARPPTETPKPRQDDTDESGWLAELDKEVAKQDQEPAAEPVKEFQDAGNGWLEDLEIDEKLKSDQGDMPDWATSEGSKNDAAPELETPPWMKATSPLEGDFYTDELAGGAEKEVEIPAWLAGYGEGEGPEKEIVEPEPESTSRISGESTPQEEYTWVPAADTPKTTNATIDLNKAAISQLESILGISYQVAKGIVTYREKHGPYQKLDDLLNVPEITDAQTIEILKPEVVIQDVKAEPEPAERPKPLADIPAEDRLTKARSLVNESKLEEALKQYDVLIKKKKSVDLIIEDLIQISTDHPLDIYVIKTLGDAYMRVDKLDQALEAYSKAEDLLR